MSNEEMMIRRSYQIARLCHVCSQCLPDRIAESPAVDMFTAPNVGPMTLEGTHAYVVGHETAYVIDPGPDTPAWIDALAAWLKTTAHEVAGILITHGHPDHAPGALSLKRRLGGVPVWGAAAMASDTAETAGVDHRFQPHQRFQVDGDYLQVLATPGHARDHVAFWLPRTRILFAGDTILGRGSSVIAPPDGDMTAYLQTLREIEALNLAIIAPGHGPIITNPGAKITEYLDHRRQREQQILGVLEDGPATVEVLVNRIYVDTDPRLLDLARSSVEAQLFKLEDEKLVLKTSAEYWQSRAPNREGGAD